MVAEKDNGRGKCINIWSERVIEKELVTDREPRHYKNKRVSRVKKKRADVLKYKDREKEEDINKIRRKVSYADLVRKETGIKEREYKRGEDKREWYEKNRRQTSPVLVNKIIDEDRKGNYYYKDYNNREEDIKKEKYGLALKKRMEQKEELVQVDKIEQIIEKAMEKNKEYIDKFIRSQKRMWGELEARISKLERKIGIHEVQDRTFEERRVGEKRQEKQNWKSDWTNQNKKDQDRQRNRIEEDWYNEHDYDY